MKQQIDKQHNVEKLEREENNKDVDQVQEIRAIINQYARNGNDKEKCKNYTSRDDI